MKEKPTKLVNETSKETVPREALSYIGTVLLRLTYEITIVSTSIDCPFIKVDIKDRF